MPRDSNGHLTKYVLTNHSRDNWFHMCESISEAESYLANLGDDSLARSLIGHIECWQYEPTRNGDKLWSKTIVRKVGKVVTGQPQTN